MQRIRVFRPKTRGTGVVSFAVETMSPGDVAHLLDEAFDIVELAKGAGASFVARATTYHVASMKEILEKAIRHKGFSVVEILSQCPTYFGRKNKVGDAVEMLKCYKDQTVPIGSEKKKENPALIERGIFVEEERPEYCSEYQKIVERAKRGQSV
jgi:2-oxoglutarate ferredoxin oxidoreductase subunit beta